MSARAASLASGAMGFCVSTAPLARIVNRFATSLHRALQRADVKQRLASQGLDTAISTPEALYKMLAADMAKWAKVVRDAGIQPE